MSEMQREVAKKVLYSVSAVCSMEIYRMARVDISMAIRPFKPYRESCDAYNLRPPVGRFSKSLTMPVSESKSNAQDKALTARLEKTISAGVTSTTHGNRSQAGQ